MIPNDQLTRAERLRLESLNQAIQHSGAPWRGGNVDLEDTLKAAERIEQWLKSAKEDA